MRTEMEWAGKGELASTWGNAQPLACSPLSPAHSLASRCSGSVCVCSLVGAQNVFVE